MTTFSARLETLFPRRVPGRVPGRRPGSRRPSLERLEDRTLLSHGVSFDPPVDYNTAPAPTTGPANYSTAGSFGQGNNEYIIPMVVATADLDGDHHPDVVATNLAAGTVSVFLNKGDGTFKSPISYPAGQTPTDVIVADFNNDALPDLAVANIDAGTVSILLNDPLAPGTFGLPQIVRVDTPQAGPNMIVAGHFTPALPGQPMNEDLAFATSSGVILLQGDGKGGFTTGQVLPVANGVNTLAAGNFSHHLDGLEDLVVATSYGNTGGLDAGPGNLSTYLNHGGKFGASPDYSKVLFSSSQEVVGATPVSLVVADLNGDENPDLAVANASSSNVSILLGNGDGSFTVGQMIPVGTWCTSVAVADFNGDHVPDLVTANFLGDSVTVLRGKGDGTFQALPAFATDQGPSWVAAADLNGDGRDDVVTGHNLVPGSPDHVAVQLSTGGPTPRPPAPVPVVSGIAYDGLANPDNWQHTLDIYLPPAGVTFPGADPAGGAPVVIWLGRVGQEKGLYRDLFLSLARQGLVVVAANSSPAFTDAVHDGYNVWTWAAKNATAYGGDPNNVFFLGNQNGAGVSALLTTYMTYSMSDPLNLGSVNLGSAPGSVRGVITMHTGIFDRLTNAGSKPNPKAPLAFSDSEKTDYKYSPLTYVNSKQPPFLVVTDSEAVSYIKEINQGAEFFAKSSLAGAEVTWDFVNDRDEINTPARAARPGDPVGQAMLAFIGQHLSTAPPHPTVDSINVLNGPAGTTAGLTTSGPPSVGGAAPGSSVPQPGVPADVGLGLSASADQALAAAASAVLSAGPPAAPAADRAAMAAQAGPAAASAQATSAAPAGTTAADLVFAEWSDRLQADLMAAGAVRATALGRRWTLTGEASPLDPLFDWLGGL